MWYFIVLAYTEVFYRPLYNVLLALTHVMPMGDLGLAVILLTLIIRMAMFPFNHRMIKTQQGLKKIEPEIQKINAEKKSKEERAQALMVLYRQHGINPISGFLSLLIQFPLLIALFTVFKTDILAQASAAYSFVPIPTLIHTLFFGIIPLDKPSIMMAGVAALSQFVQAKLAMPPKSNISHSGKTGVDATAMGAMMQKQMIYMLPVFIFIFSFKLPSAVALYWTVMNVFAIVHEAVVRKKAVKLSP